MYQANQGTRILLPSHPAPITKLPTEVLMRIFKCYAKSHPEVLDQRVVDLCLVGKYWNKIANGTPQLWTKINFTFPFTRRHRDAVLKRLRASKLQKIDVSIDFRDPSWDGEEMLRDENGFIKLVKSVLGGTEGRWRSVKVVSDSWLPLYELMCGWEFIHLPPSLESISMERANTIFGMRNVRFDPHGFAEPKTLFGRRGASPPKLRALSLSAVHVDWDALVGYQNLRKLELNNITYDVGPSFEQFAATISSLPRLEYLDVSGFCPEHHTALPPPGSWDPVFPVIHLPVLKEFTFGWKEVESGWLFLQMFQIGGSLESLTLLGTESGFGTWVDDTTGRRLWIHESQEIFDALFGLGSAAPMDENDRPPTPFISMRGVKRLKIAWTKAARFSLIPLLKILTELEEIWLEDVDENVLSDVSEARAAFKNQQGYRSLTRLDFRWSWQKEVPSFLAPAVRLLGSAGISLTAQGPE